MDEPCSALDPIATAKIEELIDELKQNFTIVIVTHSMQQAARVSQQHGLHVIWACWSSSTGTTRPDLHVDPVETRTRDYITGRFG